MNQTLITGYVNPDLDGVASMIGYAEFLLKTGRQAEPGISGEPHDEAKYLLDRFKIKYPPAISNTDNYEKIILVDSSDLNGLEGKVDPTKVIEIIDHRQIHEADKFPNAKVQIELVGAAATLIGEKFRENKVSISQEAAILIYGAVISNTLNFKGTLTTERDREMASWLKPITQLDECFAKELFLAKSDLSDAKLPERIAGDLAWFIFGDKKLGIAQIEIIGVKELIKEREQEIIETLNKIKAEMNLDFIFQNNIDLEEGANYFVASEETTKKLLEEVLGVKFLGNVAKREELIMRKQIVPLLKAKLEE
jgi:manganese-dependent inorganic pyrophosphatase